jgi:hypothetical protein
VIEMTSLPAQDTTATDRPGRTPRRDLLRHTACGFGYLAFAGLASQAYGGAANNPLASRLPHFPARAKRVIMLFMDGGPSHMDTFDYKPQLNREDGKKGRRKAKLYGSPWKFRRYGESGLWASELFPELASRHIDDLCIIKSMHTDSAAHPNAVPFFHTGSFQFTRPSVGSWVLYGLGTENENLPGFITINPPKILGGPQNYGSAFLPACYQGTRIGWMGRSIKGEQIRDLDSEFLDPSLRQAQLDLIQASNRELLERREVDPQVEGVINSLELGRRMQQEVPDVMDLRDESQETLDLYGVDQGDADNFGRMCLMARRFAEAGVRFVQLSHTNWDQHRNLTKTLEKNGRETDRPIAALLTDLKRRGMLDDTLVIWSGEFGRLPEIQNDDGRGHNADGYTMWMAGGGSRGGYAHGATDELGYEAVEDKVHLHDFHATMLHLLGLDHKGLTFRYSGRDFRLTDVHGRVVEPLVA